MGPRMSSTVRLARSFHERSQRTGPDDPSEPNVPVFQAHQKAGTCRQAARPPGPSLRYRLPPGQTQSEKAGLRQPPRKKPAQRSPALRSSEWGGAPGLSGADLQVRAGSPDPAKTLLRENRASTPLPRDSAAPFRLACNSSLRRPARARMTADSRHGTMNRAPRRPALPVRSRLHREIRGLYRG